MDYLIKGISRLLDKYYTPPRLQIDEIRATGEPITFEPAIKGDIVMDTQEDLSNFDKAMKKRGFKVVDPKNNERDTVIEDSYEELERFNEFLEKLYDHHSERIEQINIKSNQDLKNLFEDCLFDAWQMGQEYQEENEIKMRWSLIDEKEPDVRRYLYLACTELVGPRQDKYVVEGYKDGERYYVFVDGKTGGTEISKDNIDYWMYKNAPQHPDT